MMCRMLLVILIFLRMWLCSFDCGFWVGEYLKNEEVRVVGLLWFFFLLCGLGV